MSKADLPDFREKLPGGDLPPVVDLISSAITDVTDNLGDYAMAGLGFWLFSMVLGFLAVPFLYFGMFIFMMGGTLFGVIVGEIVGSEELGLMLSMILGFGGFFVVLFLFVGVLVGITVPMQASMMRAIRAHQLGEEKLTIAAPFSSVTTNIGGSLGVALILVLVAFIPFVGIPLGFMLAAAALHERGAVGALTQSVTHVMAAPGWHLGFWALGLVVNMVGAYVPVIGPVVATTYMVKGYRAVFGDQEEPYEL